MFVRILVSEKTVLTVGLLPFYYPTKLRALKIFCVIGDRPVALSWRVVAAEARIIKSLLIFISFSWN